MADTATKPKQLPFTLGSAFSSRQAFSLPSQALGAGTIQPNGFPINLGSFGWISNILLDISLSYTATATAPTLGADGLDALIDRIGVRTAGGAPLIQPIDGYTLHMDNIFGGKRFGPTTPATGTDPDTLPGTVLTMPLASQPQTNRIFRALQFEIDPDSGLGCIPATAANREFTIDLTLAAISTIFATNPPAAATVAIEATVFYWDLPADGAVPFGVTPQSQTLRLLQVERAPVNAGENKIKTNNVGNVIMNHYLIFRNGSGVRDDTNFSTPFQIDIDNNARLWLTKNVWKAAMANWFALGKAGQAIDTAGGLRSGVYVVPWRLLAGGDGADPATSHAQYLATLNTTQLVMHGLNYGGSGSLQITTDAVSTPNAAFLYSK